MVCNEHMPVCTCHACKFSSYPFVWDEVLCSDGNRAGRCCWPCLAHHTAHAGATSFDCACSYALCAGGCRTCSPTQGNLTPPAPNRAMPLRSASGHQLLCPNASLSTGAACKLEIGRREPAALQGERLSSRVLAQQRCSCSSAGMLQQRCML